MAGTTFQRGGTHTALVPQKWSKKDYKFSFEANPLIGYIGTGDDKIVQVDKNFIKEQGDKITFALRALLTGDGQTDDGTYTGNSEAMTFYDMSVELHERGHSVQLSGNMTEQAAYSKLRPKGQMALREWDGMTQASDIIASLSGMKTMNHLKGRALGEVATNAASAQIETVNQVALTPSGTHLRWFGGGQDVNGNIERVANVPAIDSTVSNLFGTDVIEYVHRMATATVNRTTGVAVNPLRPIRIDGEAWYLFLIDRLQKKALQHDAKWKAAQQYANVRGRKNWLFNGADGIWDGVVIKTTDLLHRRYVVNANTWPESFDLTSAPCASSVNVARSLFLGAQACCMAYGKMPVWKTGYEDPPHNTKYTVHTDKIYGVKKSIFNSVEFGCIIVDTAVVP